MITPSIKHNLNSRSVDPLEILHGCCDSVFEFLRPFQRPGHFRHVFVNCRVAHGNLGHVGVVDDLRGGRMGRGEKSGENAGLGRGFDVIMNGIFRHLGGNNNLQKRK